MPQNEQHTEGKNAVLASQQQGAAHAHSPADKSTSAQDASGLNACMRGLAIIGIFLHNYCHWLGPMVKENEYTFNAENVTRMNHALVHPDNQLPLHLLSFFGHYGVPVFLFLSGYGLFKKYQDVQVPVGRFLYTHYLKLFRMMAVGFVLFIAVDTLNPPSWHYDSLKVISQLLMFNNLLPRPDKMIWPGAFWFFGLMMQLYLLYRLVLHRRHWGITALLMALCMIVQLQLPPLSETMNRYRYNFMGGMLPFGLGLLYAQFHKSATLWGDDNVKQSAALLVCIALAYYLSQSFVGWTFAPAVICVATLLAAKLLTRVAVMAWLYRALCWMGGISAALFVTHPITRKLIIPISRHGQPYLGLLLYIVASIALAWVVDKLIKRIPLPKS
ncbi:acyltransferase [Hoylesella loescheii]|uniref:acyltransferase n=1 Tax=Hoylesella loescheii TaxID=840 RepID=UPI0028ED5758|nr:acyltransferase [Hoylesella loescheii]